MISPEHLRRYPFFAGLNTDQINTLAQVAEEQIVESEHFFFHEDEELSHFYIAIEGAVAIVFELPERDVEHTISDQFMRKLRTKDVVISTVGPGDVFGWSGLIPPYTATAGAKAVTPCRVIAFDQKEVMAIFAKDVKFGYLMTQKAAQVIRNRLRDFRIESLAFVAE